MSHEEVEKTGFKPPWNQDNGIQQKWGMINSTNEYYSESEARQLSFSI